MDKRIINGIFTLCMTFTGYNVSAQNTWTPIDSLPGPSRSGAVAFSLNRYNVGAPDVGYVCSGGNNSTFIHYNDLWQYDPSLGTWSQMASLPDTTRGSAISFVINNLAYVATGVTGTGTGGDQLSGVWMYDGIGNIWIEKKEFPGGSRWAASGFSLNGKGYLVGGNTGTGGEPVYPNDVWQYDPVGDNWTQMKNFPGVARAAALSFTLDTTGDGIPDKAFLGGGGNSTNEALSDFWEYDPVADSWTQKANIPGVTRTFPSGFSIQQEGFAGLGVDSAGGHLADLYEYDWATGSWSVEASIPGGGRSDCAVFSISDSAYLGTGANDSSMGLTNFYKYTATITTGITKIDAPAAFSIAPNPCNGRFNVSFDQPITGQAELGIQDLTGRIIWHESISDVTPGTMLIDPGQISQGIYIFTVRAAGTQITKKLAVE